jgi:two-component system chemotaxis response regulator CheY
MSVKTLIVEDDFSSRLMLQEMLQDYGPVHIAANGKEAVCAAKAAMDGGRPYDLICMDILMPEMDGTQALRQIRTLEESRGISLADGAKVFMITGLNSSKDVMRAFSGSCDAYLLKPIDMRRIKEHLRQFGLSG